MSYPRRGRIEPVRVQNVKRTTVQKSLPDTPIIKQTTRASQPTRTGLVLPNKSLTADKSLKTKTSVPDEKKIEKKDIQTSQKEENVDKCRSEKSTLEGKVGFEKSAPTAAKKEKEAEATPKAPVPEVVPDPVKLKEQKDLIQEVNKLLREVEGVWGSEDLKVLQKHCVTTVQHFKFARESMIQQLTDECKVVDRSKTIPELIKQVTEKTQKQRQEIEKMKSAHGKHLVHCQQISLDKMEAEFRAKYERLNEEKKKLILDKFNLSDQVNELEEYKSEFGDKMRIREKEWTEERNNLEKNLRIVSKELSRVEREQNKKCVEFDKQLSTLKKQLHEAEENLETALVEKRLSDKRIEGLVEKLKDVSTNDQVLMSARRERDKLMIKVDDLEREIKSLQDDVRASKSQNEETEKELAMTRIQKKNIEAENSSLKRELRQKRVTIKLELKEQGMQTVSKCDNCALASGRCNCPFSQLQAESVSKSDDKPERKKTTKSRKGKKSSKKLYTKSHMNVTKMGSSSEYGIDEDITPKDEEALPEDTEDSSSMAYTMRGKYEVHKQSLQLDTSQYLTPKEFSYPLEKLLRETHAARALEAETNRPRSSASSDSRCTDLTDVSTKVNGTSSQTDDNTETDQLEASECSYYESESTNSAMSTMSSKSGDLTINQSNSNTQSHTTIVCQTYVNVVDCEKVSIQKQS